MKTFLHHIANIQTGLYSHPVSHGKVIYLQLKHFKENGEFMDGIIPELPLNGQIEKHLLSDGDIVFSAKGSNNFAALIKFNNPCVASSTFLVIRLKDEYRTKILPEYLVWFMNNLKTQEWIKAKARGSSIQSVSKTDLLDLEITIPPIEKQKKILIVDSLHKKEQGILKKIQSLKEQYIQYNLISVIK